MAPEFAEERSYSEISQWVTSRSQQGEIMNRSAGCFNTVSLVFLVLTLVVLLVVFGMIGHVIPVPVAFAPQTFTMPAILTPPTDTLTPLPSWTFTPSLTYTPTRTPSPTITPTATDTATDTPTITQTPSITPIPSKTATATRTPANTKPPTATRTPSRTKAPTNTKQPITATQPAPFKVQPGAPQLTSNFANPSLGCAYEGLAGQVFGLTGGDPVTGIQVNVSAPTGFNQTTVSGSNPQFGQAGWQVQVDAKPNNVTYTIELRNAQGVPISDKLNVTFPGTCDRNLAIVNFVQTRPF